MKKIIFFANTADSLYRFRLSLMCELSRLAYDVVVVSTNVKYKSEFESLGLRFIEFKLERKSKSVIVLFKEILRFRSLLRLENPDVVISYTHRSNLVYLLSALLLRRHLGIINLTGLGIIFSQNKPSFVVIKKLLLLIYRVLGSGKQFTFQNGDDFDLFFDNNICSQSNSTILNGSGIKIEYDANPNTLATQGKLKVLFPARGLPLKGLHTFYKSATIVNELSDRFEFIHAGGFDEGFRDDHIQNNPNVKNIGFIENMQDYMQSCHLVVLPSMYREGVPRSLIEALYQGKPIITSNYPGCKMCVLDNWNGFVLNDPENPYELASKIMLFLDSKKVNYPEFSDNSFDMCKKKFNVDMHINKIKEILNAD